MISNIRHEHVWNLIQSIALIFNILIFLSIIWFKVYNHVIFYYLHIHINVPSRTPNYNYAAKCKAVNPKNSLHSIRVLEISDDHHDYKLIYMDTCCWEIVWVHESMAWLSFSTRPTKRSTKLKCPVLPV